MTRTRKDREVPRRRCPYALLVETLEIRALPSTVYVGTTSPGYSETGNTWATVWGNAGYGGTSRYDDSAADSGPGVATWTASNLAPGSYQVYTTWVSDPVWRATNAPYTVYDGSQSLGTVLVDQQDAPSGVTDQGVSWQLLGTYTVSSGQLSVRLSNAANGIVDANAIRVVPAPTVPSTVYVGTTSPGYSETGKTWATVWGNAGYGGTSRYDDSAAGSGPGVATWTASNLAPGSYQVYTTWVSDPVWRATNAPYTVYDGSQSLGTVLVDQQDAPSGVTDQGVSWQLLGTYTVSSGQLSVRLSNAANGIVDANAIRVVPTGSTTPSGGTTAPAPVTTLGWSGALGSPAVVDTGVGFTVSQTYTISGSPVGPNFTIAYYASTSPSFSPSSSVLLGTETVNTAAGKSLGAHSGVSPVLQITSPGSYNIFAQLDSGGTVTGAVEPNSLISAAITVYPPPTVTAPPMVSTNAGVAASIALGSFSDPCPGAGPWSVDIGWGDGTPDTTYVLTTAGQLGTLTHTFAATGSGFDTVTETVTNQNGLSGTASFQVFAASSALSSPTGRDPTLLWTPQQQAIWETMEAQDSPWWQLILTNANADGTANPPYSDYGSWATFAYQITGNPVYAQKAYASLSPLLITNGYTPTANMMREQFEELAIEYDWLYPALSSTQLSSISETLDYWSQIALGTVSAPGWYETGARMSDQDQTIAEYFGMALTDVATGSDFLSQDFFNIDENKWTPVGGLTPTGVDRNTMRDTIAQYMSMAAGGEWIESTDYEMNTLKLLTMGVAALDTALGVDNFPEVTQYLQQAGLDEVYQVTPDLNMAFQWGDEEWPDSLKLFDRVSLLAMLGGYDQDDPQVGPYVNELMQELIAKYGFTACEPIADGSWMFYLYNPNAATAPLSQLPTSDYSPGQGILLDHSNTTATASLFTAQMTTPVDADHQVSYFGDFELYRDGEWAVTHPLGYGAPADTGASTNSMLIAGLSSMAQKGPVAEEVAPDGSFAYIAGTTSGQYYSQPYYDAPPTFLNEWTRSLFYLPSPNGEADTVVVFDRVNAVNPMSLPDFSSYRPADQEAIESAPSLDQWIINAPVEPTITSAGLSWQTAGGQVVSVSTLLPLGQTRTVYQDSQLFAGATTIFQPSQITGWQVRISPTVTQQWETFLNVVQASNPGTQLSNTEVSSVGGAAEGALIERQGLPDALVLFGAEEATRVLSTGYTVNWTSGASSANLYLVDLNPTETWTIQVDGGPAAALPVSQAGVAQYTVSGSGPHTVTLVAA